MKTPDGYEIVYISKYFFNLIEKEMEKVMRFHPNQISGKNIALRDQPAQVEFRRFEDQKGADFSDKNKTIEEFETERR